MNSNSQSYMKQANSLFAQKKYVEAEAAYKHAGTKLGMHIVKANIWLCQKRQADKNDGEHVNALPVPQLTDVDVDKSALEAQLAETQTLLEKYYTEVQDLRFEKMDTEKQ